MDQDTLQAFDKLSDLEKNLVQDLILGVADVQADNLGQLLVFSGLAIRSSDGQLVEFDPNRSDEYETE